MKISPLAAGAFAGFLALLAGVGTALLFQTPAGTPELQGGTALPQPRPLREFSMTDHTGAAFGPERLQGRWSLVFAGFTSCPDVCPTTLALLQQLRTALAQTGPAPEIVFLSVDPERDTPERLRSYVAHFGEGITGLTGSAEQLEALATQLALAYVKVPTAGGDYTMDHSAALVLIDPQARIAAYFQAPFKADTLASDLRRLLTPA